MPCVCGQLLSSPFFFCNFFYCYPFVFFALISSFPSPRLGASSPLFDLCVRTLQTASPSQSSERCAFPGRRSEWPLRLLSPLPPSARRAPGLQKSPGKMGQKRRSRTAWQNPAVAGKPALPRPRLPALVLKLHSGPAPPHWARD